MKHCHFISAILTPLTESEDLNHEGLEAQLADHVAHGMHGLLVGGTMGQMQLLKDRTYQELCRESANRFKKHGEVLVGAGDNSLARTLDRIDFLNTLDIDGVAILLPQFRPFNQDELCDYFCVLASASRAPIFIYDLPQLLGYGMSTQTVVKLSKASNIAGIKASGPIEQTRIWMDRVPEGFRVIVAKPELMDMLCRHGVREQLDGMWAVAPKWTLEVGAAAAQGDWAKAAHYTRLITALRDAAVQAGLSSFTLLMNRRGVPGRMMPKPTADLSASAAEALLANPVVTQLLQDDPALS